MSGRTILRAAYVLCALLIAAAVPAVAGEYQAPEPFLDQLVGRWNVTGTYNGHPAKHKFKSEWTIQNNYLRFRNVSEEENAKGLEEFEVIAYLGYDAAKSRYVCTWLDNSGTIDPDAIVASTPRVGDTLPFVFKTANGTFHVTFAYEQKANRWTWTMETEKGGALQPVAKLQLNRSK
jgi:hypothetical protein